MWRGGYVARVRGARWREMGYITTESSNVIARESRISGSKHIVLSGKSLIEPHAVIRGDKSPDGKPVVALGRYCVLRPHCVLEPPERHGRAYPLKIGNFVVIGRHAKVHAAQIGSCVVVGDGCTIGKFAIIKDCVVLAPNTVVPPFAVVPPFTGPGRELPESAQTVIERFCRNTQAGIAARTPFETN